MNVFSVRMKLPYLNIFLNSTYYIFLRPRVSEFEINNMLYTTLWDIHYVEVIPISRFGVTQWLLLIRFTLADIKMIIKAER